MNHLQYLLTVGYTDIEISVNPIPAIYFNSSHLMFDVDLNRLNVSSLTDGFYTPLVLSFGGTAVFNSTITVADPVFVRKIEPLVILANTSTNIRIHGVFNAFAPSIFCRLHGEDLLATFVDDELLSCTYSFSLTGVHEIFIGSKETKDQALLKEQIQVLPPPIISNFSQYHYCEKSGASKGINLVARRILDLTDYISCKVNGVYTLPIEITDSSVICPCPQYDKIAGIVANGRDLIPMSFQLMFGRSTVLHESLISYYVLDDIRIINNRFINGNNETIQIAFQQENLIEDMFDSVFCSIGTDIKRPTMLSSDGINCTVDTNLFRVGTWNISLIIDTLSFFCWAIVYRRGAKSCQYLSSKKF
jgi:hypothetical protein